MKMYPRREKTESKAKMREKKGVNTWEGGAFLAVETSEQCGVPGVRLQLLVRRVPNAVSPSNGDLVNDERPVPFG